MKQYIATKTLQFQKWNRNHSNLKEKIHIKATSISYQCNGINHDKSISSIPASQVQNHAENFWGQRLDLKEFLHVPIFMTWCGSSEISGQVLGHRRVRRSQTYISKIREQSLPVRQERVFSSNWSRCLRNNRLRFLFRVASWPNRRRH